MRSRPRPLLIIKTGETLAEISARRGDFEAWIRAGLGLGEAPLSLACVHRGDRLPQPEQISGVVITGSSAMVSEREPWSERTAEWLAGAVETGSKVLGICYGHQLLAHALGGRVGPNPAGREIGTVNVRLFAAGDPLLGELPGSITVHESHVESVLALPPAAVLLGSSEIDPHQAFRVGAAAWGVQFHPEFDADIVRGYIAGRRQALEAEGLDADALRDAVRESPDGTRVLARFAALVSEHPAGALP